MTTYGKSWLLKNVTSFTVNPLNEFLQKAFNGNDEEIFSSSSPFSEKGFHALFILFEVYFKRTIYEKCSKGRSESIWKAKEISFSHYQSIEFQWFLCACLLAFISGEYKVYTRRWIVLVIFVFYSASNAMQWIQFSIIANVVQKYVKGHQGTSIILSIKLIVHWSKKIEIDSDFSRRSVAIEKNPL